VTAGVVELHYGDVLISTDRARVDVHEVHRFLSTESYWAQGRSFEVQRRAVQHSYLVVGAYGLDDEQLGFARMVTDLATFAWLSDVFVVASRRGTGIGAAMVRTIVEHPDVVDLRLQLLATADAHELYARFGYTPLDEPGRWMHRRR
jgi:GNAT superfamily N-acetyltransferase